MKQLYVSALAIAAALAVTTTSASAAIVCNRDGDCWRAKQRYDYGPKLGLRVYGDNWHWRKGEKYRWREAREGRGYWRRGVWIQF